MTPSARPATEPRAVAPRLAQQDWEHAAALAARYPHVQVDPDVLYRALGVPPDTYRRTFRKRDIPHHGSPN